MNVVISLVLLLALSGCSSSKSKGGQDIGGGNATLNEKPTAAQLESYVRTLEAKRVLIFRSLAIQGQIAQRTLKLPPEALTALSRVEIAKLRFQAQMQDLIFKNPLVSQIIEKAKIELRMSRPCYTSEGREVDGSRFADSEGAVCLSGQRLLARLTTDNFEIETLALYVHEVSHHFETNEAQAEKLQRLILEIGPNFKNYLAFLFQPESSMDDLFKRVRLAHLELGTRPLCSNLHEFHRSVFALYKSTSVDQLMIPYLRLEQVINLHTLLVFAAHAEDFCTPDQDLKKQTRAQKWKGRQISQIRDIYPDPNGYLSGLPLSQQQILSQNLLADLSLESLAWVGYQDQVALKMNLDVIQRLLRTLP